MHRQYHVPRPMYSQARRTPLGQAQPAGPFHGPRTPATTAEPEGQRRRVMAAWGWPTMPIRWKAVVLPTANGAGAWPAFTKWPRAAPGEGPRRARPFVRLTPRLVYAQNAPNGPGTSALAPNQNQTNVVWDRPSPPSGPPGSF